MEAEWKEERELGDICGLMIVLPLFLGSFGPMMTGHDS